jgi:hypothetical protein
MKTLFTLFLTCMISLSLMGQHDIKELKELKEHSLIKKHHSSFSALEKKMSRSPEFASKHLSRQFKAIQRADLKADAATDQTLDSILWELYDTTNSLWVLTERELFAYDGNGNMIQYVWFAYDTLEMKILPSDKEIVQHNAQGKPTEIVWLTWDKVSGQWVNEGKFELTYDGDGNQIQETWYDWDAVGSQWQIGAQFDMTYDGDGNLLFEEWSYWDEDSSKLILTYKDEYLYEGGKLTTWNEYWWEEGEWVLYFITTNTYSAGGNLLEELTQGWDYILEQWGDYSKNVYTYNGADKVITEEVWEFDWFQYMMVKEWLYEYTWDTDGNMTVEVDKSWDELSGTWLNTWKSEWTFNKNFTIFNLYAPYWFMADVTDLTFVHMPVSELGYMYVDGEWVFDYRQTAYYSDFGGSTSTEDMHKTPISVFPNPASETIRFDWGERYARLNLELYDLTGKSVINRILEKDEILFVDQLSRGIYLYKLTDNNNVIQTGKISLK